MRAAALQYAATPFNLTHNLETAGRLARQAAGQGARLIVLPELFNTGCVYSRGLIASADGPALRWLTDLSVELGACVAGTLLEREGRSLFNTLVLAGPTGSLHRYRKQHPFLWERCFFEAGREPLIAETEAGRLGLLIGWDSLHPSRWEAYRGKVDALLIASAAPRLHRAVLNFPLGRKVYLGQMMPDLLRQRAMLDGWFEARIAAGAAWLGEPVVHAALAGRFVTELPRPRLSFLAASLTRPRYWPMARQAHQASLRASFYGGSAIYDAQGKTMARVEGDEGIAVAEVSTDRRPPTPQGRFAAADRTEALVRRWPATPAQLSVLDGVLRVAGRGRYKQDLTPRPHLSPDQH